MTWGSRHGTRVLTHTHIIKPPFQIWKNPLRESSAAIDADGARVAHIGHLDFTLQRCRLNLEHRAFSSTKMVNLSQQKCGVLIWNHISMGIIGVPFGPGYQCQCHSQCGSTFGF